MKSYLYVYLGGSRDVLWDTEVRMPLSKASVMWLCIYNTQWIHTDMVHKHVTNLQGCLRYHTAKPSGQVTADVVYLLCVLAGGSILICVWVILYNVNGAPFALTLLSAFLLHVHTHTPIKKLLTNRTRGIKAWIIWSTKMGRYTTRLNTLEFIYHS